MPEKSAGQGLGTDVPIDHPLHWEPSKAFLRWSAAFLLVGTAIFEIVLLSVPTADAIGAFIGLALMLVAAATWFLLARGRTRLTAEAGLIFGVPDSAELGLEVLFARIDQEDRRSVDRAWQALLGEKIPFDVEHRILGPVRVRWVRHKINVERSPDGEPLRAVGTVQDVTERKQAESQLERLAHYDALTGLPNRALLHDRIRQAKARAGRRRRERRAEGLFECARLRPLSGSLVLQAGTRRKHWQAARRQSRCYEVRAVLMPLGAASSATSGNASGPRSHG